MTHYYLFVSRQGLRHVFGIGEDGDSRGAARIFFLRTLDKSQNTPTPKLVSPRISFTLFWEYIKGSKMGENKKMVKRGSMSTYPFSLNALVGDNIRRILIWSLPIIFFLALREGSLLLET